MGDLQDVVQERVQTLIILIERVTPLEFVTRLFVYITNTLSTGR